MPLKQDTRQLKLTTPLGEDVLLLTGFAGQEDLSQLFRYQLEMISDRNDIEAKEIVGKNVTFSVKLDDGSPRFFNGFVSRFVAGSESDGRRSYRAEVVPWLWFLTQTTDCRIFQNKKVPDIIQQIFKDLGFSDFTLDLKLDHKTWEYCVQYRETDFQFVSRLMEQEGIFYFFEHKDGKHVMKIADHRGAYVDCVENDVIFPGDVGTSAIKAHITSWEHQYEFRPGKWAQTDYNFTTPSTSLMSNTNSIVKLPDISKYEMYDYPGEYATKGEGEGEVKVRMEEQEAWHDMIHATSFCKTFTPGGKFTVSQHPSGTEEGKTYVVRSIRHQATEPLTYETGQGPIEDYSNSFTCIPDSVTFRPPRVTPTPKVSGVQTAVVVGPGGEEIYTDKYGRVKVQFHWDREGKKDENSSCWVRVSQNWAGKQWGIVFHPRIGQEVIVDFLEGDPDRPIIVGRVYNAEQMPPYELPANQTQSGIKSRSSKGGGPANFNEIRFEDKKGSEQLFIHAEKNQDIEVENDETHWVGHDRFETIDHDRTLHVKHDKFETVDNRKTITVGSSHTESIGSTMNITIGNSLTENVALNYVENVGVAMSLNVGAALAISVGAAMAETIVGGKSEVIGGSKSETIGGNKSLTTGSGLNETIGGGRTVQIGKDLSETIKGKHTETATKEYVLNAKKIQLVGKEEIVLKTGSAEIVMKKNGDITIKGNKINVKGSGDVVIKGSQIKEN